MTKEIRSHQDVPKRARNSISAQIEKLVKKYGDKSVRLVVMKYFTKKSETRKLEDEISKAEEKLNELKRRK